VTLRSHWLRSRSASASNSSEAGACHISFSSLPPRQRLSPVSTAEHSAGSSMLSGTASSSSLSWMLGIVERSTDDRSSPHANAGGRSGRAHDGRRATESPAVLPTTRPGTRGRCPPVKRLHPVRPPPAALRASPMDDRDALEPRPAIHTSTTPGPSSRSIRLTSTTSSATTASNRGSPPS
jgi:hypothetical protein